MIKTKLYCLIMTLLLVSNRNVLAAENLYKQEPALYSYVSGAINSEVIKAQANADIYTLPASCLKVVTGLLAYKVLGKDFTYKSQLYEAGEDIVIKFSGDPTFTSQKLRELLLPIRGTKIAGSLVLDNSLFIVHPHSTNIIVGDRGTRNARPISALVIDENFINLTITPGKKGQPAQVISDAGYEIRAKVITDENPTAISSIWEDSYILVQGNINLDSEVIEKTISPMKIENFAFDKIEKILKELSIEAKIKIINDDTQLPAQMKLVKVIESPSLEKILPFALENSDNMIFDILFLSIIHKVQTKKIRDWGEGNIIIKELIKQYLGVDVGQAIIADGSGLSPYNRLQPRKLFEILKNNYSDRSFILAMPKIDYINKALGAEIMPSYLKAKTGTLLGFRCLCGYDLREENPGAFVIMASGFEPLSRNINRVLARFVVSELIK